MRDIQTNDATPSGVVLPEGAYGFVSIIDFETFRDLIGNFRIIDITGYEYRTNAINTITTGGCWACPEESPEITFSYNTKGNITLSDVVGIAVHTNGEVFAADILDTWISFDVDILNEDEVIFSCRNVIFACTD